MKTKDDLIKDFTKNMRVLCIGTSGSGKTYFAHSYPKTYTINTEPGGMDTVASNPKLRDNIVGYESFIPGDSSEIKDILGNLKKEMAEVKEMVKQGKVETIILDNITYLADTVFTYYYKVAPVLDARGNVDKWGAFMKLDEWLKAFTLSLLTMPCHIVVTCHEKLESDEAMEKKSVKDSPIVANIFGGFRNKIEGMFSYVLYISKLEKGGKYEYWARSNKGSQKNGKSRLNLPPTIQDISYGKLLNVIKECSKEKGE